MADWSDWVQDVSKNVISLAANAKYQQPYEVEKMRLQALSDSGMLYQEGQPAQYPVQGTIPANWLVLGGLVILAVVLLKD